MGICDHWSIDPIGLILSLHASNMSVCNPPRLYIELIKFLNFDINADPDPAFHPNADPDPRPWMQDRAIPCDCVAQYLERLYFELLQILNFDINADPDPAFHSNADPDPACKNNATFSCT